MANLVEAVRCGDVASARRCLAAGESPDSIDEKTYQCALTIAADRSDVAMARLLLDHGADPNFLHTMEWPLDAAVCGGCKEIVELLLDHDAEPDVQDEDGCTPLISAAAGGHLEIVELLLEAGADPRCKDRWGKRPIIFAAEKGHMAIVELLAPLSTTNDRRQAELMIQLKKQGPPSDSIRSFIEAAEKGDIEAVKAYLDTGGEVDVMNQGGETALLRAAAESHFDVVKLLVSHGANVNHMDALGSYPLLLAELGSDLHEFLYERTPKRLCDHREKAFERAIRMARERGFVEAADLGEKRLKEWREERKEGAKKEKEKKR